RRIPEPGQEQHGREDSTDLDDEHHGIAHQGARVELSQAVGRGALDDLGLEHRSRLRACHPRPPYRWSASTTGPSATTGRNVSAPTITITPMTSATKSGVWVGNVPTLGGTFCLRASACATASVGMMRKNRPTSMQIPSVVFIHWVSAALPAKGYPLLFAADVYA